MKSTYRLFFLGKLVEQDFAYTFKLSLLDFFKVYF